LRFSCADLEGLITGRIISGHRMFHGEGQRPNSLIWFITSNAAGLSRDMAQRCVIVRLKRPERDPLWESTTWKFIDDHRWEIIGDIITELKTPTEPLKRFSRWGAWEQGVLAHVAEPSDCQKVIEERQEAVDQDSEEAATVRQAFLELLRRHGYNADTCHVFIPSADAAHVVNESMGEKRATNKACAYLNTLGIDELSKSAKNGYRGFAWKGQNVDVITTPASWLSESPPGW